MDSFGIFFFRKLMTQEEHNVTGNISDVDDDSTHVDEVPGGYKIVVGYHLGVRKHYIHFLILPDCHA